MTILYYKKGSRSSVYSVNTIHAGAKPHVFRLLGLPPRRELVFSPFRIGITLETIGAKKPAEAGFKGAGESGGAK